MPLRERHQVKRDSITKPETTDNNAKTSVSKKKKKKHQASKESTNQQRAADNSSKQKITLCSVVITILKFSVFFIVCPPIINYAALQQEYSHFKENATLYDIGWGQLLNLKCSGNGTPTVVLDAATGMTSDMWWKVQALLSKETKVCSYDRAGLGLSGRPVRNGTINANNQQIVYKSLESTAERMWEDLERVLGSASDQRKPFVLVGAELGSLVTRFFAHMAPDGDVCGLVMIDPLHDSLFTEDNGVVKKHWKQQMLPGLEHLQLLAATGLARLALKTGLLNPPLVASAANSSAAGAADVVWRQQHALSHPRHVSAMVDEHFFINESLAQLRMARTVKSIPDEVELLVLSSKQYDSSLPRSVNQVWERAVTQLISELPPRASHIQLPGQRDSVYRRPRQLVQHIMRLINSCRQRYSDKI